VVLVNIFYVSDNPVECAQALDNLRLNKMLIESIQMLSTAISKHTPYIPLTSTQSRMFVLCRRLGFGSPDFTMFSKLAKPTHENHPCTVWAGMAYENFMWLVALTKAMHDEWLFRGHKPHACFTERMPGVEAFAIYYAIDIEGTPCPPPNCSMFSMADTKYAYKKTLAVKWANDKRKPGWGTRGEPEWRRLFTGAEVGDR
jgi:hypothetical protein